MLPGRPATQAVAADILEELVSLWRALQARPDDVVAHYRRHWSDRQARGGVVFDEVRTRFNAEKDPLDLLFLSRTCVNGLIRFNRAGGFNNTLHHTRPGIHPDRFAPIVAAWSRSLEGVRFEHADFRETLADAGPQDAVFLDPPYRGNRGRYRPGDFEPDALLATLEDLNRRGVPWMLTWDGRSGERSFDGGVPEELYRHREPLPTGNAPFPRLIARGVDAVC